MRVILPFWLLFKINFFFILIFFIRVYITLSLHDIIFLFGVDLEPHVLGELWVMSQKDFVQIWIYLCSLKTNFHSCQFLASDVEKQKCQNNVRAVYFIPMPLDL